MFQAGIPIHMIHGVLLRWHISALWLEKSTPDSFDAAAGNEFVSAEQDEDDPRGHDQNARQLTNQARLTQHPDAEGHCEQRLDLPHSFHVRDQGEGVGPESTEAGGEARGTDQRHATPMIGDLSNRSRLSRDDPDTQ